MMRVTMESRRWQPEAAPKSAGRRTWASTVWLVAGTIAVAVTSYALSLQVASERRETERLARQNVALQSELKALDAELRVRMRMPQLQRWNDTVLGLVPISATQYLAQPVQLAAYGKAPAAEALPRVQLAVRDLPPEPAPAAVQPLLVKADVPPAGTAPDGRASLSAPAIRPGLATPAIRPGLAAPAIRPVGLERPVPESAPADLLRQVEMSFGAQPAPRP